MGTTYRTIIQDMAGGVKKGRQLKAIHVGGPAGCVVPPRLMNIPISYENLKSKGLVMGSGGILVLDDQNAFPHDASSASGSSRRKTAPPPARSPALTRPPRACAKARTSASPSPAPRVERASSTR